MTIYLAYFTAFKNNFQLLSTFQQISDISVVADPSFLVLSYPKILCSYYNLTMKSSTKQVSKTKRFLFYFKVFYILLSLTLINLENCIAIQIILRFLH